MCSYKLCQSCCRTDIWNIGFKPVIITKRIKGFNCIKYEQRIAKLGLLTLELRRLHLDLIFCYKIVFGLVSVNFDNFFTFSTVTNTRGHKYKLYKSYCRCNTRRFFFAERVINVRNLLPPTVNFSSLASFKRTIRKVDMSEFLAF